MDKSQEPGVQETSAQPDNVTVLPNLAEIKQEAAEWLVRIDQRPLSDDEVQALHLWSQTSDYHLRYLIKLAKNWDAMAVLSALAEIFPASGLTGAQENSKRLPLLARLFGGMSGAMAAALSSLSLRNAQLSGAMAVAALVAMVVVFQPGADIAYYQTAVGERASYTLKDGTVITLNTASELTVDYSGPTRNVHLSRGEANFEVAKNPDRPFVVFAGQGQVQAIGTAFNVRYTEGLVDVVVTEGRVKVGPKSPASAEPDKVASVEGKEVATDRQPNTHTASVFLDAGQGTRYQLAQTAEVRTVDPVQLRRKLAWQSGALIFDGEALESALREISRYTEKQIVIVDPGIKNVRIGGHFKTDDIEGLLVVLDQGFGIQAEVVSANRIHLSAH